MDKLGEALVALVVLSIIIERGLAIIFDTKAFRLTGDQKAMIAIGVSAAICFLLNFDIITLIPKVCADCGFGTNRLPPWVGTLITCFVVAGGSAGADRMCTRLNSSHYCAIRMPSSARKKKNIKTQSTKHQLYHSL